METPDFFDPRTVIPSTPERDALFADPNIPVRADGDFRFVHEAVMDAHTSGQPLDEDFVRTVAVRRLEHAEANYRFGDAPGAGPTIETSTRIVADIVELHQIFPVLLERTAADS